MKNKDCNCTELYLFKTRTLKSQVERLQTDVQKELPYLETVDADYRLRDAIENVIQEFSRIEKKYME